MKLIWAPWRIAYIEMEKPQGCILCDKPKENDDVKAYILYRGKKNFVMLNSYPYNPGHLMVAPYEHIANMEDLPEDAFYEHWKMVNLSVKILREAYKPGGFNIGINMGRVAGAGVEKHIHTHIVPRWGGDTSFMQVTADVKVIPQGLAETYEKLKGRYPANEK